jgi:hypothetical protein
MIAVDQLGEKARSSPRLRRRRSSSSESTTVSLGAAIGRADGGDSRSRQISSVTPRHLVGTELVPVHSRKRPHEDQIPFGAPGPAFGGFGPHAVFVETDNPAGNQVVSYLREPNGQLVAAGTYNTGGVGG